MDTSTGDDTGPATLTPEVIEEIRSRAKAAMADGKTTRQVSNESGVAYATLSAWLANSYTGRNDRVAVQVRAWLQSQLAQARTRRVLPTVPGFLLTATAGAILERLEFAQHAPDIVTIMGAPGVGKTMACEAHAAGNSNVWIVTAEECVKTPRQVMLELAETLGLITSGPGGRVGSGQWLSRMVVRRLRGSAGLIVLDEAQHLTTSALDQLRTLHDKAGIGIALVGNEEVRQRIEGTARDPNYAQLFSRVGMRLRRDRPVKADVRMLAAAWGLQGPAVIAKAEEIAAKPGGLRGLTKALVIAHGRAGGAAEAIDEKHLAGAWRSISDEKEAV